VSDIFLEAFVIFQWQIPLQMIGIIYILVYIFKFPVLKDFIAFHFLFVTFLSFGKRIRAIIK
jgi:hypothetical protein